MGYVTSVEDGTPDGPDIPEDTIHKARVRSITPKEIHWKRNDKDLSTTLLNWRFEVTDGEFVGRNVWGSTDARLSLDPRNKYRPWAETLLGRTLDVGTALDTDDLIGLTCEIAITYRADRTDPAKKYVEVGDLIPTVEFAYQEPPF